MRKTYIGNILIIILIIWLSALFVSPDLRYFVNDLMASLPIVGTWFERFTQPLIEEIYSNPIVQSFYPSILVTLLIVMLVSFNAIVRLLKRISTDLARLKMRRISRKEAKKHIQ